MFTARLVVLASWFVALSGCSCQRGSTEDAGTNEGRDAGLIGRLDQVRVLYSSPRLIQWYSVHALRGYQLTYLERDSGRWTVSGQLLSEQGPQPIWEFETDWYASILRLGNDMPEGVGVVADGINPNRYPRWYVIKAQGDPAVYATCEYGVIPLAGAVGESDAYVVLPKDCTGRCPSQENSAYWHLESLDSGVEATLSCFGDGQGKPHAIHPDRSFELRNVAERFIVRDFVADRVAGEIPGDGVVHSWKFLPGQRLIAYGWEQRWSQNPLVPRPTNFQHELRIFDFDVGVDAGARVLPEAARDLVVLPSVARTLADGSLALSGRPRRYWERGDQMHYLLVMDARATVLRAAYRFQANPFEYDVVETDGGLRIVTSLKDGGSDGGQADTIVYLTQPEQVALDGG